MTVDRFDFHKPAQLPSALAATLAGWGEKAASRMTREWDAEIPFAPDIQSAPALEWASDALAGLPEDALRFRAGDSLLVVPRPLMVVLVGGLLGEPLEAAGLDRPLSPIEDELVGAVVQQFFLSPLQAAWPLPEKLSLDAPRREPPTPAPPSSALFVLRFTVRSSLGEWEWRWMLPRAGWLDSLAVREAPAVPKREDLVAHLMELPLDVTVNIGTVGLPLLHLAALQPGDVLLLDQPIDRPLPVIVGDRVKLLAWPGACGTRQAVAVHSLQEDHP